jgi:hypothetical protein
MFVGQGNGCAPTSTGTQGQCTHARGMTDSVAMMKIGMGPVASLSAGMYPVKMARMTKARRLTRMMFIPSTVYL